MQPQVYDLDGRPIGPATLQALEKEPAPHWTVVGFHDENGVMVITNLQMFMPNGTERFWTLVIGGKHDGHLEKSYTLVEAVKRHEVVRQRVQSDAQE